MIRDKRGKYYTIEKIGPNQELTPEGFLLCRDVPIARTGKQQYHPSEIGMQAGPDGFVYLDRDESEVFRPETIASFFGKSITNDHPDDTVTPLTWRHHTVGVVLNVRRSGDLLLADLLVCDHEVIKLVQEGKTEVSCGYDAETIEVSPGNGRQVDIVGNHVAIVEKGRCGSQCAIKDSAPSRKENHPMKFADILKKFHDSGKLTAEDQKLIQDAAAEEQAGAVHVHIADAKGKKDEAPDEDDENAKRLKKIEDDMSELLEDARKRRTRDSEAESAAQAEKDDEKKVNDEAAEELDDEEAEESKKIKDSAPLASAYQNMLSRVEVIAPGTKLMTFDSAARKRSTLDSMNALRRKALGTFIADGENAETVTRLRGGRKLTMDGIGKLSTGELRTLFDSVAAYVEMENTAGKVAGSATASRVVRDAAPEPVTVKTIQALHDARWKKQ